MENNEKGSTISGNDNGKEIKIIEPKLNFKKAGWRCIKIDALIIFF